MTGLRLSQKFDLESEVSGKHQKGFRRQCKGALNPKVNFNVSKHLTKRIIRVTGQNFDWEIEVSERHLNKLMRQCEEGLNPNIGFNISKQLSKRNKRVTGQKLTMGRNKSEQDTLNKG